MRRAKKCDMAEGAGADRACEEQGDEEEDEDDDVEAAHAEGVLTSIWNSMPSKHGAVTTQIPKKG